MSLTITLDPANEARLMREANDRGMDAADLAARLVTEHLSSTRSSTEDDPTIALLEAWLAEDATDDPENIRKAQEELDDFKRAINAERERVGAEPVYP